MPRTSGETGIEGFDDWARELVATGYLHNHARMWFASIWIFTLKLPWGASASISSAPPAHGDSGPRTPCHGAGWRGSRRAARPSSRRRDNIERFTQGRFAPDGLSHTARNPRRRAPRRRRKERGAPRGDDPPQARSRCSSPRRIAGGDACPRHSGSHGDRNSEASEGRSPGYGRRQGARFTHDALADALARAKRITARGRRLRLHHRLPHRTRPPKPAPDTIVTAHTPIGPARSRL